MHRLFVGIQFPAPVNFQLRNLCAGLPGAKWVNPDGFHLTLRFLGEIDGRLAEDIDRNLAAIQARGFTLTLRGVGQFGQLEKAHTVWAGAARNEALYHLRDKVESAVVRAGAEPDHRRFMPHVTLGKLRHAPVDWLETYLLQNVNFQSQEFAVNEFVLFSSHSGDNGRLYLPEATYPLNP
jgi:RNA 2',3'-cyclic 3'-phosphodiesterase